MQKSTPKKTGRPNKPPGEKLVNISIRMKPAHRESLKRIGHQKLRDFLNRLGGIMKYRQTFVIEYEDPKDAPAVGANMKMLGGDLIAVRFDDALEELEAIKDCCSYDDLMRAHEMREKMKSERS